MSDLENKNKQTRIKQQKNVFVRNIIICICVLLVFSLLFWLVNKSATGTEISYNEFQTQLTNGNIKEIQLKQSKIQIYYVNDEAHWIYNRESAENTIVELVNDMFSDPSYTGTIPKVVFGTTTTVSILSILYGLRSVFRDPHGPLQDRERWALPRRRPMPPHGMRWGLHNGSHRRHAGKIRCHAHASRRKGRRWLHRGVRAPLPR